MSDGEGFLSFLSGHPEWRRELMERLQGDPDRICVYYICPLGTLPLIVREGIKCHDAPRSSVDLSSPEVQSRRHGVWLGRWDGHRIDWKRNVPVHSCVNLFWNPLNTTFEAFQRNALLRAEETGHQSDRAVCIVEVDAERILTDGQSWWCATNRNLAADGFHACQLRRLRDPALFDWPAIFGPERGGRAGADRRAAELIVHIGEPGETLSTPLPPYLLRRVIAPSDILLSQGQLAGLPATQAPVFRRKSDLLNAELRFVQTVSWLGPGSRDAFLTCLTSALRDIVQFERNAGGLSEADFVDPAMAHGWHGIGHAVRVMFWSAALSRHIGWATTERRLAAAIAGARCHDLCRRTDSAEERHGAAAAVACRAFIQGAVGDGGLAEQCLDAMRDHDWPEGTAPFAARDPLADVLSDADALDRGRFGTPTGGNGCSIAMLRTPGARDDPRLPERTAWMAHWLARMTMARHTRGADRPCHRWVADVGIGVRAALRAGLLTPGEEECIATRIAEAVTDCMAER